MTGSSSVNGHRRSLTNEERARYKKQFYESDGFDVEDFGVYDSIIQPLPLERCVKETRAAMDYLVGLAVTHYNGSRDRKRSLNGKICNPRILKCNKDWNARTCYITFEAYDEDDANAEPGVYQANVFQNCPLENSHVRFCRRKGAGTAPAYVDRMTRISSVNKLRRLFLTDEERARYKKQFYESDGFDVEDFGIYDSIIQPLPLERCLKETRAAMEYLVSLSVLHYNAINKSNKICNTRILKCNRDSNARTCYITFEAYDADDADAEPGVYQANVFQNCPLENSHVRFCRHKGAVAAA